MALRFVIRFRSRLRFSAETASRRAEHGTLSIGTIREAMGSRWEARVCVYTGSRIQNVLFGGILARAIDVRVDGIGMVLGEALKHCGPCAVADPCLDCRMERLLVSHYH